MESIVDDDVIEGFCEIRTLLQHAGSGSLIENIDSMSMAVLDELAKNFLAYLFEFTDASECNTSLRSFCALLQLKRSISETGYDDSDPAALKFSKTAIKVLLKLSKDYDSTGDLLCRVIHSSLLLMSANDMKTYADYLVSKCESSLSVFLKTEGQQYAASNDSLHPQIAVQLLTVMFDAAQKMLTSLKSSVSHSDEGCHYSMSHDVVIKLALCQYDALRAQTLMLLIPKLIQLEGNDVLLRKLLQAIVSCNGEEEMNRALGALSALSSFYLPETKLKTTFCAGEDGSFWMLVQNGICSDSALSRKHALYLIRKFISNLSSDTQEINNENFFWCMKDEERLNRTWQDICTILEVLEERAIHLVSPALDILENHFSACVRNLDDTVSVCFLKWFLTIFKIVLKHSCTHVIKWGVETLLSKAGSELVASSHAKVFQSFISPLIQCLNTSYIFYDTEDESQDNQGFPEIFEKLEKFFVSAAQGEWRQMFFHELFDVMGTINWAPIPTFAISRALSKVPPFACLRPGDMSMVKAVAGKLAATQNISIRATSLHHLLIAVTNLYDSDSCNVDDIVDIFSAFYFERKASLTSGFSHCQYLPRGTGVWKHSVKWLHKISHTSDVFTGIDDYIINTDHFSPVFAQLLILLLDGKVLKNLKSLESSFTYLSDCANRLYVDQEAQTRCIELLAHMVAASRVLQPYQNIDITRKAVLNMVETTLCSILELMRSKLLCTQNLCKSFHFNTRLMQCLELLLEDKDTAQMIFKEKLFMDLIFSASMSVEGGDENQVGYFFALNILKCACKPMQNVLLQTQANEKIFPSARMILLSKDFNYSPAVKNCGEITGMEEMQGLISSGICEAQWMLIAAYLAHSCDETMALKIVEAVGVALDVGGRDMLPTLCKVFGIVLAKYPLNAKPPISELRSCWRNILQMRHKEIFHPALREFLRAIFQPKLIFQVDWSIDFVLQCAKELLDLGDSAPGIVSELTFVLQSLIHQEASKAFLSPIRSLVIACFMFGPVQRRDQKFLKKIILSIEADEGLPTDNDHQLGKHGHVVARSAAAEMVLFMMNGSDSRELKTQIADQLAFDLIKETESPDAAKSRYFANSLTHRIQLRVLQGLMLVQETNSEEAKQKIGRWLLKRLIEENHQLSVRYLTEWLLVRILCCVNSFQTEVFRIVEKAGDFRESAVCSIVSTLLHTSQSLETLVQSKTDNPKALEELADFLDRLFVALIPLTMAQAYSVRFNSHVAILRVWESMERLKLTSEMDRYRIVATAVHKSFHQASNRFQSHNDFYLSDFQSQEHHSLETLFYELPRLTGMSSDEWIKPEFFRKVGVAETGSIPLFNKNRRLEQCNPPLNQRRVVSAADIPSQQGCLQKKMVPSKWLEMNEVQLKCLPELLRPGHKEKSACSPGRSKGLVVVASLLDKASNLGGLSRTCEIMGASLVLPKLSYTTDREFQALSMSSEMWAQLYEVKPFELTPFLTKMKKLGFTLVGAEQTASSVSLSNVRFEQNTVLLLGNEREGVPANLLPLLDICVEIPQYGLVRSLNVHVAGALFMYEYMRQHAQNLLHAGS